MKFVYLALPCIPATMEERKRLRPIGRNRERYQQMLDEVRELCVMADDAGFDAFATTEHHFHSEGFEMSVRPLLLYADLAARTKRIKFMPQSVVLPAHNPIVIAEEMAILDHLSKGRLIAGFARGYQPRWSNVLGQLVGSDGVAAAPMDGSERDQHNRRVHQEWVDIIYKAWTNDLLVHDGEFFKVPFPKEGIAGWTPAEFTREYGAPGEIDENGVLQGVSVCPAPYQDPYPRAIQSFSLSESTIEHTAKIGATPLIISSYPPRFRELCEMYQKHASNNGRELVLGDSVGCLRSVHFGDTEAEAVELFTQTQFVGWQHYFAGFGFFEAFRMPKDEEKYAGTTLPPEEWTVDRMREAKFSLSGTIDQVKREIEAVAKVHGDDGQLEYFTWFADQGLMPFDEVKRQLEIFAEHILPEFT